MAPRQERHGATRNTWQSPRQAKSGPVIAAPPIMILVFGSFMFGARELAEFGFGLGFSVLVDALLIRACSSPPHAPHRPGNGPARVARPHPARLAVEAAEPAPPAWARRDRRPGNLAGPGHTRQSLARRTASTMSNCPRYEERS